MGTLQAMTQTVSKVMQVASGDLWGGAEAQVLSLCCALQKHFQLKILLVLLNDGELANRARRIGVEVSIVDESQFNAFSIYKKVKQLMAQWKPHIVHTHREKENVLAGIAAAQLGIPCLRSVHGAPEHLPSWFYPHKKLVPLVDRWVGRRLQQKIVAVSEELKRKLELFYPPEKLVTVENGVDLNVLAAAQRSPDLRFQQPNTRIGIVGRLVPVKRVDRFVGAAKKVLEHRKDIEFVIYGDGPLKETVKQQIETAGMQNSITLAGHCNEIHSAIAQMDILVMTSDHEGLPITLLESMYLGTPVVASAVGAIPKVTQEGKLATMVESLSPEQFASEILNLVDEPSEAIAKAKNAVKHIEQNYSATANAEHFVSLYRQLVEMPEVISTQNVVSK